jgi:hypothetical protein
VRDSERSPKDQIVARKENLRRQTGFSLRRAVESFVNAMQEEDKSPSIQNLVGSWVKKAENEMPHWLRSMHILRYGSLIIALIAVALFAIAGFGNPKK